MSETEENVGGLTDQEVKLLQGSWAILAEDKKTNGVKLFMKLFEMYPKAQDMFKMFKNEPLKNLDYNGEMTKKNRPMVAHGMSVMYAMESYIDSLDDMECLTELVRKTARSHLARGIGRTEFLWMLPVIHELIDSVTKDRDDVDVEAAKKAWTTIMTVVADLVESESKMDNP